jgi:tetratricopeptide (TPR) repeat protein
MKTAEAVKRLDELRYAWRGDNIELTTLVTLAPLFIEQKNPRLAFECWQTIIRYFPNDPAAETARQSISNNLTSLFDVDPQQMEKPIETLALYHDFINYAPTPQIQEQITRKLIDDLTSVGLYSEAAEIYLPLVSQKPDPNAPDAPLPAVKPEDIFRLAGIYLLDGQAEAARNLLKTIDRIKLPPEQAEEHRLLSARADFQDNKLDDALAELGDLNDAKSNQIRSDIYWRQQKWVEAAKMLRSLLGDIPPDAKLSDDQTRNILEQAVALSLSGDQAGVASLREKYGTMMDATDQSAAFRLVTLPPKGSEVQSIKSIQSRLGDVDGFASFLQGYRKVDAAKTAAPAAVKTAAPQK